MSEENINIIKGTEHPEEFDHREQDEWLLTDEETEQAIREAISKQGWIDITVKQRYEAIKKAQLAKAKQYYEQEKLEIENRTIRAVLVAIEKHGLGKVLALRDKRQDAYRVIVDLSDPLEVTGKGRRI